MTVWTGDRGNQFTWSRFVQSVTDEPDGAVKLLMGFVRPSAVNCSSGWKKRPAKKRHGISSRSLRRRYNHIAACAAMATPRPHTVSPRYTS
jgi:hypothetical protein